MKCIGLIILIIIVGFVLWHTRPPVAPTPNPSTDEVTLGKCFIGGCSGQICSDQEGVASDCMFKEEYACYKTATCARQASGECGWTPTSELVACLAKY